MKILNEILKGVKESKGFLTAKDKYVDYREAHRLQYGFLKGIATVRPDTLGKRMNVLHMNPDQWEQSEGQYIDTMMVVGYTSKYAMATAYGFSQCPIM